MGPYYSWQELGPGSRPQLHAHYRINHVALWVLGPNFGVSPKPGTLLLLSSGVLGIAGVLCGKFEFLTSWPICVRLARVGPFFAS
jgi:hypothetical protein